jgi:aryl-alcohol dehydrogenase-like predicted oxidoreductase
MSMEEDTMSETSTHPDMPYRVLGRTGERVSAIGLGGWHLGFEQIEEPLSIRIIRTAIDRGITYEDPHRIFDEEGANAALVEAGKAGKLRYIGFTATRTRASICTCSRSRRSRASRSTRSRCR